MVIECPDVSYIDEIVSSPRLDFAKQFSDARLGFILHNVGTGVLDDVRYVEWMKRMDSNTEVGRGYLTYKPHDFRAIV